MRFGKQQVAWGKAIGSKMLDVVNPQDMRELNQLDFEDSRIPLLTANFIYTTPWKGSSIQLLLIPDIESHYVPPAGYPFSPSAINSLQQLLDAGIVNVERSATSGIRVPQNLENMEIGVKWYQNLVDFEYSLNYFYHWSDLPGMYFNSFGPGGVLNYDLKFHRFHTLGGSFTNYFHHFFVFEDTILRGELAIHLNDRVSRTDPVDPLGTKMVNADSFNYLLALDMWPITNYYLTIQFFQFICMNYHSDYLLDAVDNTISVYFSTDFFAEQIMPNLLLAYSDDGAFWFRARCKYKHSDVWSFHIGTNLYFGGRNTKIGQFGDVDNIFAEVKYAF